jgi:Resolvase, N terminal domain
MAFLLRSAHQTGGRTREALRALVDEMNRFGSKADDSPLVVRLVRSSSDGRHWSLKGLWFAKDMTETNPQTRRLGYARVSTYGQTLDAQLEQLRADGCAKVYREKASGASYYTC